MNAKNLRERGLGLLIIICAIAVLSLFTGSIMSSTVRTLQATSEGEKNDRARYAAYSGIQSALQRLNRQPDGARWSHYAQFVNGAARTAPPSGPTPDLEDCMLVRFPSDPQTEAIVNVYNNTQFCPPAFRDSSAPDGTQIPPGQVYISATAMVEDHHKLQIASVGTLVNPAGYVFDRALFANTDLKVEQGVVDSFDSTQAGPTGSQPAATGDYATFPFYYEPYLNLATAGYGSTTKRAPVGSNRNANSSVVLGSSGGGGGGVQALVDGDVFVGLGSGGGALDKQANGDFTGTQTPATKTIPKTFAPTTYDYDKGDWQPAANTPLSLEGGKVYVCNKLTLDANDVTVTGGGEVAIYVAGKVDMKNGTKFNWGRAPRGVQIYLLDSGANTADVSDIKGSFLMVGGASQVRMTNSELFGAVMADKVNMQGNSMLHFDVALSNQLVGKADFSATQTFGGTAPASLTASVVIGQGILPSQSAVGTGTGTSGTGTSGTGTSGTGTSGTGTSGTGTSGTGTSGTGTSGTGTSGTGTSGTGTSGTGTSGSGTSGSGTGTTTGGGGGGCGCLMQEVQCY